VIAVVPVRSGELPSGAGEAVAEAGGSAIVAGEGTPEAAEALAGELGSSLRAVRLLELGPFGPARFANALAPFVEGNDVIILPGSPDGRDLAPRLAAVMGRPLLAGALAVTAAGAEVVRWQGSQVATMEVVGPFVATLLPGSRAVHGGREVAGEPIVPEVLEPAPATGADPELVELVAADPAAVDLSEAVRIVAGGAGLGGEAAFRLLERVAVPMGASVGGTRVVTDAGYLPHDRQIGTTGLSVAPRCYVALGISGAAQHLGGIRAPEHVISVNLDPSCPMMAMADLALVGDAKSFLEALAERLGVAADA
jgi:electron transfer flavoprotein alpha subunit